jgi:homoserine dehydrogenase
LSSFAYNEFVDSNSIYTEGISKISPMDMNYAEQMDSVIKLIAISKRVGNKVFARVSPAIISRQHPLSNVEDVFNAIVVKGDAIGDAMFYGRGAGKLPTASAVVADVIDIVRHIDSGNGNVWPRKEYNNLVDFTTSETRYFVRVKVRNMEEAKRFIRNTFKEPEFIQLVKPELKDELGFVTEIAAEGQLSERVASLKGIGSIKEVINTIRIEEG